MLTTTACAATHHLGGLLGVFHSRGDALFFVLALCVALANTSGAEEGATALRLRKGVGSKSGRQFGCLANIPRGCVWRSSPRQQTAWFCPTLIICCLLCCCRVQDSCCPDLVGRHGVLAARQHCVPFASGLLHCSQGKGGGLVMRKMTTFPGMECGIQLRQLPSIAAPSLQLSVLPSKTELAAPDSGLPAVEGKVASHQACLPCAAPRAPASPPPAPAAASNRPGAHSLPQPSMHVAPSHRLLPQAANFTGR